MEQLVDILELRRRIPEEVFDYQTLLHALGEYSAPRNRIGALLQRRHVLQVKRGLYVFAETLRKQPVPREWLSNLLHGPSYVSAQSAMQLYGMIPEQVTATTAMCLGRGRAYQTSLGLFLYTQLPSVGYAVGVTWMEIHAKRVFIATPEKAIADAAWLASGAALRSAPDVERLLLEDFRMDDSVFPTLRPAVLAAIRKSTTSRRVEFAMKTLQQWTGDARHA